MLIRYYANDFCGNGLIFRIDRKGWTIHRYTIKCIKVVDYKNSSIEMLREIIITHVLDEAMEAFDRLIKKYVDKRDWPTELLKPK